MREYMYIKGSWLWTWAEEKNQTNPFNAIFMAQVTDGWLSRRMSGEEEG